MFSREIESFHDHLAFCCTNGHCGGSDYLARNRKPCYSQDVIQTKGNLPVSEDSSKRSPEERNIRKQLGKVRRYLAKSTDANMRSSWESRIAVYEAQLVKAEARPRWIG